MAQPSDALWKGKYGSGGGGILLPSANSNVIAYDSQGNRIGQANRGSSGHERNRRGQALYKYDLGGNLPVSYVEVDGKRINIPNARRSQLNFDEDYEAGSGYSPDVGNSPGGNPFIIPGSVDFSGLEAPYVSFQESLDRAREEGQRNKAAYYDNLAGSKDEALGLIDTDIEGIYKGVNALAPLAREQGDLDTETNKGRASNLDAFNLERTPEFDEYNQAQWDKRVDASGLDTRRRFQKVAGQLDIETTGKLSDDFLDGLLSKSIQNRGSDLVSSSGIGNISGAGIRAKDRLEIEERIKIKDRAQGLLPDVLAKGQDLLTADPVRVEPEDVPLNLSTVEQRVPITSSISAGDAQQKIGTQATEYETIPASQVLNSSLQTEQFNEEGQFKRDTYVLDAEQGHLNAIDNAYQGAYNTDKADSIVKEKNDAAREAIKDREKAQDQQAYAAIVGQLVGNYYNSQRGNDSSANGGVYNGGINPGANSTSSTGTNTTVLGQNVGDVGQGVVDQFDTDGDGNIQVAGYTITPEDINDFIGSSNAAATGGTYNKPKENISVGGASGSLGLGNNNTQYDGDVNLSSDITPQEFEDAIQTGNYEVEGASGTNNLDIPDSGIQLGEDVGNFQNFTARQSKPSDNSTLPESIKPLVYNPKSKQADTANVSRANYLLSNWNSMSGTQRTGAVTAWGVETLVNNGFIDPKKGYQYSQDATSLATLFDKNSNNVQRASALASLYNTHSNQNFTGSLDAPKTINGVKVVSKSGDGKSYTLQDGTVVKRDQLLNGVRTTNTLNAIGVLTSGATNKQKIQAVAALGLDQAAAEKIVTDYQAGAGLSALALYNTATNWDDMSDLQRVAAVSSTSARLVDTYNKYDIANGGKGVGAVGALTTAASIAQWGDANDVQRVQIASQAGAYATKTATTNFASLGGSSTLGTLGTVFGVAAVGAGLVLGVKQASDVISAVDDMPRSQAVKQGATGLAVAGAGIGAAVAVGSAIAAGASAGATIGSVVPVVGTAIGLVVGALAGVAIGATGTGKNSGQIMRDGWKKNLKHNKVFEKGKDGNYYATLADGSKYDIGKDGNHKLKNKDGGQRHTFDIDWSDKNQAELIPDAHLFAIGTGMLPGTKFDGFHRTTAQMVNAATSNAKDVKQARSNMKVQFDKAGIDPRSLALNVELMRNQNKISDQAYNTYMGRINSMFGTKLLGSSKADSTKKMIAKLQASKNPDDQKLLKELTDQKKLAENQASKHYY